MSSSSSPIEDFIARLNTVESRLSRHALGPGGTGLTQPDPRTGEQWEGGQIWAHLAEFLPYWIGQANTVATYWHDAPVPFGRVKSDPRRLAAIERDRRQTPMALFARVSDSISATCAFLQGLPGSAWDARGRHPTLGVMSLAKIVDEFLVGHLEEHASQLDELQIKDEG